MDKDYAIVGCLSVFECGTTIGKTLRSILPFVDRIIAVDGSYEGFTDHTKSRDHTELRIRGFPKPYILVRPHATVHWADEMDKRNKYLLPNYWDPSDWSYRIDGDEYIQSGIEETLEFLEKSTEPYHSVMYWKPQGNGFVKIGPRLCLIRYVPDMQYVENHHTLQYPDGRRVSGFHGRYGAATVAPLNVVHDQRGISQVYAEARAKYDGYIRPVKERKDWLDAPDPDYSTEPTTWKCPKCRTANPLIHDTPTSIQYDCRHCGYAYKWAA
jgi:hypothetical protein